MPWIISKTEPYGQTDKNEFYSNFPCSKTHVTMLWSSRKSRKRLLKTYFPAALKHQNKGRLQVTGTQILDPF